jgi:hypothetical protein
MKKMNVNINSFCNLIYDIKLWRKYNTASSEKILQKIVFNIM